MTSREQVQERLNDAEAAYVRLEGAILAAEQRRDRARTGWGRARAVRRLGELAAAVEDVSARWREASHDLALVEWGEATAELRAANVRLERAIEGGQPAGDRKRAMDAVDAAEARAGAAFTAVSKWRVP